MALHEGAFIVGFRAKVGWQGAIGNRMGGNGSFLFLPLDFFLFLFVVFPDLFEEG